MSFDDPEGRALTRTRYGKANPEWVVNPLWELSIDKGWTGYALREYVGPGPRPPGATQAASCRDYAHSSYRDSDPGPFFSWERFGRTTTALPDGRVIHIAGEHEDSYDFDFCIYNDVVVEFAGGRREIYLYPKDVFPPTDFHTATLFGDTIWLVGALGYKDGRRADSTQVLKLDTKTLRIERVETFGAGPGWISRHTTEPIGDAGLLVSGGKILTANGDYKDNAGVFELDTRTATWTQRAHGDESIFPVTAADYDRLKNPAFGAVNPERSDNRFWIEMARRNWSPRRARLHFGDQAPPEPETVVRGMDAVTEAMSAMSPEQLEKFGPDELGALLSRVTVDVESNRLVRERQDVVWTSAREDALHLVLGDGRRLQIGGHIDDFGDDYADPWVYNDVIVRDPDGRIAIYTYPIDDFPPLYEPVGVEKDGFVYIFGILDRRVARRHAADVVVLLLHLDSMQLTPLDVASPSARPNIHGPLMQRQGAQVIFPVVRQSDQEPLANIAFDLECHSWGRPTPE